ncbi:MAG: RidA family protein [Pseudomonadota bacterium]
MTPNTGKAAASRSAQLQTINPPALYDPTPNGYSHVVVSPRNATTVYVSGQGGEDQEGQLSTEFEQQVQQAYKNLQAALQAAGASSHDVAKITTYVVDYDPALLPVMTRAVQATFGDTVPAQTLVPVPRLALDGMLFEVEAIAALS